MILLYLTITAVTFVAMEGITWLTHKYIMHGLLGWYFHEDHHQPGYSHVFEKNDFFFVVFAIPCMILFYLGTVGGITWLAFLAAGVLLYGICYFLVHDVLIHRRFKWFDKVDHWYFRGLRKGHKIHHKHLGKEDGECFGMLYVPKKYFIEARKMRK